MYTIEFRPGQSIESAAKQLIEAARIGGEVQGKFNGITLTATADADPKSIVTAYHKGSEDRHVEYVNSPAGRAAERERENDITRCQEESDNAMADLEHLDFSNEIAVLDWLCGIVGCMGRTGVVVDRRRIVSVFESKGFEPGVNCEEDFRPDDRDNVYRYLVGQALSGIISVGSPHDILLKFANEWKAKFAHQSTLSN